LDISFPPPRCFIKGIAEAKLTPNAPRRNPNGKRPTSELGNKAGCGTDAIRLLNTSQGYSIHGGD
jgi:hypothetical protein